MEQEEDNWMPLESNPEVINAFIKELGFDVSKYSLCDVLSTEEWAQEMVPQPVLAVFFLFPISEKQITFEKEQVEKIKTNPQTISPSVYFMKQYAGNACGTIAAFHAIANAATTKPDLIGKGSYFEKYLANTKSLNFEERGNYFKKDKTLQEAHTKAVHEGSTEVQEEVNTHFIAFVEVDGSLYELDGRKNTPINHGACKAEELLPKACGVIQQFMERDPGEIRFTIMALAQTSNE